MDQRGSFCPFLLSSETTAKGTGLGVMAGKKDPVELDFKSDFVKWYMRCRIGKKLEATMNDVRRLTYIIVKGILYQVLF